MIPSLLKDRIGPRALTALLAATIVMAGSSAAAAAPTDPPPGASPPPPSAQGPVQAAVGGTTNDYPGVSFASGVLVKAY
ncbi:MAG: hypothetical protein JWN65_2245, partial [Solirubrobacterales bacterium]|nr:hypothetical protein [Solirubrobacterales bacterium]